MKKKVCMLRALITFAIVAFLVCSNLTPAYAWKAKTHVYSANLIIDEINKNNGYVEVKPIRAIVEAMGGTVGWENSSKQITITARGNTIKMWLGKKDIVVNGISRMMDVAPFSQNGRTYVPIRFATENLDAKVDWIGSSREIVITY